MFVVLSLREFQVGMMAVTSACKDSATKISSLDNGKYVRYTPEQVEALERLYYECPKPSSMRRQQLIRECPILSDIEPKQIKVWFQNRRYFLLSNCFRSGFQMGSTFENRTPNVFNCTDVERSRGRRHPVCRL